MSKELKIIISAVGKGIKQTTGALTDGLSKSSKAIKVFDRAATGSNTVASGLAGQIKGLVAAYLGFTGMSSAVQMVQDAETATYNLQTSVAAANREFENVGSVSEWEDTIGRLSDELVIYSNTALKNAISRTVDMTKRLGLSKDQMEEVIKRSADLGAGKVALEDAIERVTSALRGEAEASEYLGLTLNENYVKGWYEANKQTEKAWKDLSEVEKAQVRYNVMLEQSNELQGKAAGSAKTFSGAVQLVKKEIENAVTENKDMVAAMNDLADTLRENAGEIGSFISQLVSVIAKVIEFAVKYKEMLAVIAGTLVAVTIVGKLVAVVRALNAAFIVMTGLNLVAWFSSLRAAIAAAATSMGLLSAAFNAFVVVAAAQGVYNIVKLVDVIWEWRDAAKDAKIAQDALFKSTEKLMDKYKDFAHVVFPKDLTSLAQEDLAQFNKILLKSRAYWVSYQTALQEKSREKTIFGGMTDEAKEAQKDLKAVEEKLYAINKAIGDIKQIGIDVVVKKDDEPGLTSEQLKEIAADQKRLEEQLANELIEISGNKWTVLENKAKKHYEEQQALAHGNADLLTKAEKVFSAEMVRIQEARQKEILDKEKKLTSEQAKNQSSRLKQISQTALVSLSASYDKAEITLAEYFERRRELIDEQYAYETGKLTQQIDTETDEVEKIKAERKLFELRQQNARDLIKLKDEELAAEQELADNKIAIENMLADMRLRTNQEVSSALNAQFAAEMAAMDQRHNEEIDRLEDLNAKKEEINEAYRLQKLEKDQQLADQERRIDEYRLAVAADMAGSLSDIMSGLYEATGEKNKEFFYLAKAAAIAEATINAYNAANKALKEGGAWMGKVQAAIILAAGMANVAKIKAQTLATGGTVLGHSPHDRADNVPIMATAGEFMQPVASVKYYGQGVMEAIRKRLLPREIFSGFSMPAIPSYNSFALASGGSVPAANQTSAGPPDGASVNIVNVVDPRLISEYLATSSGQNAVLNVLSSRAQSVKRIIK